MKILQVVNIGFEAGGAEKSVRLITEGLTARGHAVQVVATDMRAAGQTVFADHLVPAIRGSAPRRFLQYLWYQEAYRRIRGVLDRFAPDCVHLHTIGEFSPAVLAATAGRPRILTVHGPEDWTLNLLRWNLASASSRPALSAGDRARYAYLRFVQRPAYRLGLRRVDRILTPSRFFADQVKPDVGSRRTHVVPNGVPRSMSASPVPDAGRFLYVGRLEEVKGVAVLLDAFRLICGSHPRVTLTVVGDGAGRARLAETNRDLVAAGRVTFTGWLGPPGVADRITRASVVVLPSLWPENFPTVALEALQAGRPLIASRVGGLPELVGPDNGVLVPPGDPVALAGAMAGLTDRPEVLNRLGRASAARAARYDAERFLETLELHYQEICR